jgi:hypothetical protein
MMQPVTHLDSSHTRDYDHPTIRFAMTHQENRVEFPSLAFSLDAIAKIDLSEVSDLLPNW